jgi:hypothetical protein
MERAAMAWMGREAGGPSETSGKLEVVGVRAGRRGAQGWSREPKEKKVSVAARSSRGVEKLAAIARAAALPGREIMA